MLVEYRRGSKTSFVAEAANSSARMRAFVKKRGFVYAHGRATPVWTMEEDNFVRQLYPHLDQLCRKLKRRTRAAIKMRARVLGVQRKSSNWTAADVSRLRRLWPHADKLAILESFPGRSWGALSRAATGYKLHRPKRLYQSTGCDLLDSIRARCESLNYTMRDLDAVSHTGTYFFRMGWIGRVPELGKLAKATKALGGKLSVSWDE